MPFDINLRTLVISEVYAHPIPKRGDPQRFTTLPCVITDKTRDRIEANIKHSIGHQRLSLQYDSSLNTPARAEISKIIHHYKGDLKTVSTELARQLCAAQAGNISVGMLLVASAHCNNSKALVLMKLDNPLQIANIEREVEGGGLTYDLSELPILGIDKNKVFKAAIFVSYENDEGDLDTAILASDHQASGSDGKDVADFFLKDFLGCSYNEAPASVMKRVFDIFMESINKDIEDTEVKTDVACSVLTTLQSNNPTFNINDIISDVYPEEAQPLLRERLAKNNLKQAEIENDRTEIDDARYLSCVLSNGLKVIGPKDQLLEMLKKVEGDELQELHIDGTVVRYNLRKRL
jgi:hypothetical protein